MRAGDVRGPLVLSHWNEFRHHEFVNMEFS